MNNKLKNKGKKWFVLIAVLLVAIISAVGINVYQNAQLEKRVKQRNYINSWNDYFIYNLGLSVKCHVGADGVTVYEMSVSYPPDLILEIEWFNMYNSYDIRTNKGELLEQYLYFCEHGICEENPDLNIETLVRFCEFDPTDVSHYAFSSYGAYLDYARAETFRVYGEHPSEEEYQLTAKKVLEEYQKGDEMAEKKK